MPTQKIYRNAPITEAIIDLRVEPRKDITESNLNNMLDDEKSRYPKHDKKFRTSVEMKLGEATSFESEQQYLGFVGKNLDGTYIFQAEFGGFSLSRLFPYENWQTFSSEAKRLWDVYRKSVSPESVMRLAVRNVNRIDIPTQEIDLKDYFRTSPEVSEDLPQALAGFFMQLRLPQEEIKGQALINQTIVQSKTEDGVSIVLDIDVFRNQDIPTDDGEIWQIFEKLRVQKNKIFEACITNKTRELFD